jgi:penicillin-insensitive murein DD-endopeptidase
MRTAACLLALALAAPAGAEPLATKLFSAITAPTPGVPDPIGSYARGCAGGNVEMPESGPTWQMMRLSRDRNWGNPVTVQFLEDLSTFAAAQPGWKGLYIGDIGQPRGGPMPSGHQSHQIGLDADIWYLPPKSMTLSRGARETVSANTVRTADQTAVNGNWTPENAAILQHAAADPRVDRIFVAAAIKLALCKTATAADTSWLQKLRPWYGHDDHFHVRLKCPAGATECQPQTPTVSQISDGGSGCDASLTWWVTTYLEELKHPPKPQKPTKPAKPPKPKERGPREYVLSDLPAKCADIVAGR